MELEPITRQEKIIAGQDLTPITRMEKFLKQYGGGGGGGGGGGISVKDDGAGNVEITEIPSGWTVTDDGNGNVVIGG